ncbi:Maf family protein [Pedobacter sp. JY14-1]|uniref:Maf family protein n=1 Tax=Pedobacter sp. JY14-1 TaxID=3034151 RepID=UPI0023E11BA7|nr:Maf family protein [Pedobacter sp. JY14-1]
MYKQTLPIVLASKSPRRQELLRAMGLEFSIVLKEVDESYPEELSPADIAVYISDKKARAFAGTDDDHIVLTADTIVAFEGEILGKPSDRADAVRMLSQLSGSRHEVYTGVTLAYKGMTTSFYDLTEVYFSGLTSEQIEYYIDTFKPFDKAGAYGIQDWIGMIAVEKITGSYTNVMGLPTERLYRALMAI